MKSLKANALAALVAMGLTAIPSSAEARDHDRDRHKHGQHWDKNHHKHHGNKKHKRKNRWERWDNRRDARRAGAIAGIAASSIARAVAEDAAKDKLEECLELYNRDLRYEAYCREQYYYDEQGARRAARRTGVIAGITTREIVRD